MKLFAAFTTTLISSVLAVASPQITIETGTHEPVVALNSRKPVIGLASAGSTFTDLTQTPSKMETVGSASLVRIKKTGHLAVLTAAHVVGGDHVWVEVNNKKVRPKSMWIDNDSDVALLDIGKAKSAEALIFDKGELKIAPSFMKGIDNETIPMAMIAYYHPGHALGFALRPWVDAGVESAYTRSVLHVPIISQTEDGRMIRVHTKITSGASGSAVLDLKEKSVAGLVVESHYYFSETYLVSPKVLVKHFDQFAAGKRGVASKTVWRMNNRLEYRIFADGTQEANFVTHPTSGVIAPTGNGVLGQPGNGILGQPGNGVIGQPAQDKPFQPWSEDPRSVFEFFHVEPGLKWKNESVIGFDVKNKSASSDWPTRFELLAEPEGARFLNDHKDQFEVTPILEGANYIDILRTRLGASDQSKKKIALTASFGPAAMTNYSELWEPDHISVEITEDKITVKAKVYTKMNRQTWKLEDDTIEFTLGKNGAPVGESKFLPVIATKGLKTGETFYVDLRQFFFTDYSQIARPIEGWTKENAPFEYDRFNLKDQIAVVGFSVRNAQSGTEFSYGFKK